MPATPRRADHRAMGLFSRKKKDERLVPCPVCSKLLPAEALECDLCGADLREQPVRRPYPAA
jgi:hypothetical protein